MSGSIDEQITYRMKEIQLKTVVLDDTVRIIAFNAITPDGVIDAPIQTLGVSEVTGYIWLKTTNEGTLTGWVQQTGSGAAPSGLVILNVQDFGASPNPLDDSTSGFQLGLNAAAAMGTQLLFVPPVNVLAGQGYTISSTVTIPPNVILFGAGANSLIFNRVGSGVAVFQFASGINRSGIQNMQVIGNSAAPTGRVVSFVGSQFNFAKNMQIWYQQIGIDLSDGVTPFSAYNVVEQCEINLSTQFGIRAAQHANSNTIIGGRIFFTRNVGNTAVALGIDSARALSITGLALEDYNVGLQIGGATTFSMTGCYFEKGATIPLGADFDVLSTFAESPFFEGGILFNGNHHADPWPLANGFIDAAQYGVLPDGLDHSTQLQHALDDAAVNNIRIVMVPAGTIVLGSTVEYHDNTTLQGQGSEATVFNFTGTGWAFQQSTPGVRIFYVRFMDFYLAYTVAAAGGIHLDDVSLARLDNVTVQGPGIGVGNGSGFRCSSVINGGAVYNAFYHCRVLSCENGYDIQPLGSNDTHIIDSRATACTRGVYVLDSNHIVIDACAIESGTRGVVVDASISAVSDSLTVSNTRFEGNSAANIQFGETFAAANVRYPSIHNNHHVTGTPIVGSPSTPSFLGDTGGTTPSVRIITPFLNVPFYFERTVAAPAGEVAFHVVDSNTGSGTPVTVQITTERVAPQIQGVRASITRWSMSSDGSASFTGAVSCAGLTTTTLAATGNVSFITSGQNIFHGDGVSAGNVTEEIRKADGNNFTYQLFRLGTTAAGLRILLQWDSNESWQWLVADTSGNLLAAPLAFGSYDGVNGRSAWRVARFYGDRGTTLVNGDIVASAGFGTGSSVAVTATGTPKDMRGEVTVTVGTTPGANPTLTLTFTNGTYGTVPFCVPQLVGGTGFVTGTITRVTQTRTATTMVWTFIGTPLAGETYTLAWGLVG